MPPSNAYLTAEDLEKPEKTYPLRVLVCTQCWLVQTEDFVGVEDLFRPDYAYFSSTSSSWLAHAKKYCETIVPRLGLSKNSFVVEVACNDGYLLKNFVAAGMPCLGIEPTASTAAAAEKLGIPVKREFFTQKLGQSLAAKEQKADLIIGNNVYAHVPDINDFTQGLKALLKFSGTITLEFPHLMRLIESNQFDTVYHEHFSYLSLHAVNNIFAAAGLKVYDVEELTTHGGSLRIYGCHAESTQKVGEAVAQLLGEEKKRGVLKLEIYAGFQSRAEKVKDDFLGFLLKQKQSGKKVAAYGAAAKGNTLLNFAGVKPDLLTLVCDAAPSKQNKYLPGSHISIRHPDALAAASPDYVVILPWNIADEVVASNGALAAKGTHFVTFIPGMRIR